jgi:hypothetical protein
LDQSIRRSLRGKWTISEEPTAGEGSILAATLFQPSVMIEFSRPTAGFQSTLTKVALDGILRLIRVEALVSAQESGVTLANRDLDRGETPQDTRHATGVVSMRMSQRDPAQFQPKLAQNPCHFRSGRRHRAVHEGYSIVLPHQVAVILTA